MAAFFKSKVKVTQTVIKNIYTPRSKAPKRNCKNEQEVLALIKDYGFESFVMDDLSQSEQIELFSSEKNVMEVHGSSYVNLMYSDGSLTIFDLIERNHKDLCYSNMATIFGVDYVLVESQGVGPKENFRDNDIIVDLKSLNSYLYLYLK